MNLIVKILINAICLFSISSTFASASHANGAAFNPGAASSPPRPVKQSDLYLNKEEVLFEQGKVSAIFWVINPTDEDIKIGMGFPLEYRENGRNYSSYIDDVYDRFSVYVNGVKAPAGLSKNLEGDYPIIILWDMTYQANAETVFKVEYPMLPKEESGDIPGVGSQDSWDFKYITHTGAYWARPIVKATFRFCDRDFVVQATKHREGSYVEWGNGGWSYEEGDFSISPKPYAVDSENSCIVWERSNWVPQKNVDDISVYIRKYSADYSIGVSDKEFMDSWCGIDSRHKNSFYMETGLGKINNDQYFSQFASLSEEKFTKDKLNYLTKLAYIYAGGGPEENGDWVDTFYRLPEHLNTDYKLLLLSYLRNSIFAKYGYKFKDEKLKACFSNIVSVDGQLNAIEAENVVAIKKLEDELTRANKKAWSEVNSQLVKD